MSDFPVSPSRGIIVQREKVVRTPFVGFRGQLTGAAVVLYTAPTLSSSLPTGTAQAAALVKSIILTNTDTVTRTVTLYAVESGGSVAANRAVYNSLTIAANTTIVEIFPDDCFCLGSNETVQGLADVTLKVNVRLNVLQLTPT